jgi:hypothetical protein
MGKVGQTFLLKEIFFKKIVLKRVNEGSKTSVATTCLQREKKVH